MIDVDTSVGLVTFPDASAIVAPIHASFRPVTYTLVEIAIPRREDDELLEAVVPHLLASLVLS